MNPISVREYLSTSYRPDRELIDGQLLERNVGEYEHSRMQGALLSCLDRRRQEWNIRVLLSLRLEVAANRFRIPDVCVISRDHPIELVFTHPPLICIEVLSKDDTLRSMQDRIDDYLAFGVPNIWVLDPAKRRAYICNTGDFREPETRTLQAASSPIHIPLDDLFAELD
jgi:Uma2 family endonuclease